MRVRSFNPKTDAEAVARCLSASFCFPLTKRLVRHLSRVRGADRMNRRVVEDDGRVAGYLEVVPKKIYIGRALLKTSGIGGVCTNPAARMKGCGRALMEDAVDVSRDRGYDLSVLYGIPDFYHKYGYEVVMASYQINIAQDDLPRFEGHRPTSAVTGKDIKALRRFYNAQVRFHDGNCLRRSMPKSDRGFKLTDSRGRIAGYAAWTEREGTMVVHEALARDVPSGRMLLQALRRIAWEYAFAHVSIRMPFGYPATEALRSCTATFQRRSTDRKGCMGRVINLPSLVRKLEPEWESLLAKSEFAGKSRSLSVKIGGDALAVRIVGGRVKASVGGGTVASTVSPQRFAQMVFGYRSIRELAADTDVSFRRADLRILEVLFPERNAFLFELDKF